MTGNGFDNLDDPVQLGGPADGGGGGGFVFHCDDRLDRAETERKDFFGFFFRMGKRPDFAGRNEG